MELKTQLQPKFDFAKSFYNKAFLVELENNKHHKTLQSYNTKILTVDTKNKIIYIYAKEKHFTLTTNRHINEFLKQFALVEESLTKKQLLKILKHKSIKFSTLREV